MYSLIYILTINGGSNKVLQMKLLIKKVKALPWVKHIFSVLLFTSLEKKVEVSQLHYLHRYYFDTVEMLQGIFKKHH